MSLGFDNMPTDNGNGGYLRSAGLQMEGNFVALTYVATEAWEGFDIELTNNEGKTLRERTFGANIDKVYPKAKYEKGVNVGTETKQEAFDRVNNEISQKIFHLALCFADRDVLVKAVSKITDLRDLIDKTNKVLASVDTDKKINFLTIWKNSEIKQRSNVIIADKIKWVEPTAYNAEGVRMPAKISLTKYQMDNGLTEKYPYVAGGQQSENPVMNAGHDDLPF